MYEATQPALHNNAARLISYSSRKSECVWGAVSAQKETSDLSRHIDVTKCHIIVKSTMFADTSRIKKKKKAS